MNQGPTTNTVALLKATWRWST